MAFTILFCKFVGPVLLVRALSILIDRPHFLKILDGLEKEVDTVTFSMFPVGFFMACTAILVTHSDTSSIAAIFIYIMAWGGLVKSGALMVKPQLVAIKAKKLGQMGFLWVVLAACLLVGVYFTWFGYFMPISPQ